MLFRSGTNGKTHGERNDSTPAPSAPAIEMEETTDFPALADTCEFVYMYHMLGQTLVKTVAAAALSTTVLWCGMAQAAELVMFEQAGCVYCQRWERDVGSLYEKTDEARVLPLRRVDIQQQKMSGIALASPVRFTPTFVVADNGRDLTACYGGDQVDQALQLFLFAAFRFTQIAGNGLCRHCRLLGGDGQVQHVDQRKAEAVDHAVEKA